jgi:glycerol kinase
MWKLGKTFAPVMASGEREARLHGWADAVRRSRSTV